MIARARHLLLAIAVPLAALPRFVEAQGTDTTVSRPALTVRTFTLRNLTGEAAFALVRPYLRSPGADIDQGPSGMALITVRETESTLATIERVLGQFDRVPPTVTFRFQLIVATDAQNRDPALAKVDPLLRDLFRFGGYRLLSQTAINASAGENASQTVGDLPERFQLHLNIADAQVEGTTGTVRIRIELRRQNGNNIETLLSTGLTIPLGQTVVLGSAVTELSPRQPDAKALILTVQPELVKPER
jgi:hypothetical protein